MLIIHGRIRVSFTFQNRNLVIIGEFVAKSFHDLAMQILDRTILEVWYAIQENHVRSHDDFVYIVGGGSFKKEYLWGFIGQIMERLENLLQDLVFVQLTVGLSKERDFFCVNNPRSPKFVTRAEIVAKAKVKLKTVDLFAREKLGNSKSRVLVRAPKSPF